MKTFVVITLTIAVTWFVSTQLNINWPKILLVSTPPPAQSAPEMPKQTPQPTPIPEPKQTPVPAPQIPPQASTPSEPAESELEITSTEQLEFDVVKIVNEVRIKKGIPTLEWDDKLHNLAKMHCQDMSIREDMFHSPVDAEYAENCWSGAGLSWEANDIVESWLSSKYHRTWLLCPNLERIAVGIDTRSGDMYASWTFWRKETKSPDWWYEDSDTPPDWLY